MLLSGVISRLSADQLFFTDVIDGQSLHNSYSMQARECKLGKRTGLSMKDIAEFCISLSVTLLLSSRWRETSSKRQFYLLIDKFYINTFALHLKHLVIVFFFTMNRLITLEICIFIYFLSFEHIIFVYFIRHKFIVKIWFFIQMKYYISCNFSDCRDAADNVDCIGQRLSTV